MIVPMLGLEDDRHLVVQLSREGVRPPRDCRKALDRLGAAPESVDGVLTISYKSPTPRALGCSPLVIRLMGEPILELL